MPTPQRSALGVLFLILAAAFTGIGYAAGRAAGGRPGLWVIVAGAVVLALWLGGLALRAFR